MRDGVAVAEALRGLSERRVPARLDASDGLARKALEERRAVTSELVEPGLALNASGQAVTICHLVAVPMLQGSRRVGVVMLGRASPAPFAPGELEAIEQLATQAAVALESAVSFRRAVHLANVNQAVLDATTEGIRLVDRAGSTLFVNAAMARIAREDFALGSGGSFWGEVDGLAERTTEPDGYREAMATIAADPELAARHELKLAATGRAYERFTAPVRDASGAFVGRIFTLRDVTAAREADRVKDEIVATVSHELRTPLTSIIGYLQLVLGAGEELSSEHRSFLEVVDRNAHRLLALVGDLLFVAQFQAGKLTFAAGPVDFGAVVRESVERARWHAVQKGVALAVVGDEAPRVLGDRARLVQLIDNLLSNVLKFTPAGGKVEVRVENAEEMAVIHVEDSGIGVAAADQERLFERFFRASTATEHAIAGTGLGLSIAKTVVEGHGGTIGFSSREGVGTTFRVELPLPAPAELAAFAEALRAPEAVL